MRKMNPAYIYVLLIAIAIIVNLVFKKEGNILLICVGLGFMNVIYILDKILKKL